MVQCKDGTIFQAPGLLTIAQYKAAQKKKISEIQFQGRKNKQTSSAGIVPFV